MSLETFGGNKVSEFIANWNLYQPIVHHNMLFCNLQVRFMLASAQKLLQKGHIQINSRATEEFEPKTKVILGPDLNASLMDNASGMKIHELLMMDKELA